MSCTPQDSNEEKVPQKETITQEQTLEATTFHLIQGNIDKRITTKI